MSEQAEHSYERWRGNVKYAYGWDKNIKYAKVDYSTSQLIESSHI